jgi:protein-tyrosine phosphatase
VDWITQTIAIGNYLDAQDAELLRTCRIRSVLSLDGTVERSGATELGVEEIVSLNLIDGAGNDLRVVELAVESLVRLASSLPPVLVQCHAGRSRSPLVVARSLVRTQ